MTWYEVRIVKNSRRVRIRDTRSRSGADAAHSGEAPVYGEAPEDAAPAPCLSCHDSEYRVAPKALR